MGNRAVITTEDKRVGVYLHWNGGRDSVEAFLKYCKLKGYRPPDKDCYGWARLCQVISNFFGGTCSIGIDSYDCLDRDNGDNGVYIIKDWEIVGREYFDFEEQHCYSFNMMLDQIDSCMPETEQLGTEFLTGIHVPTSDLKVGDRVYFMDHNDSLTVETDFKCLEFCS